MEGCYFFDHVSLSEKRSLVPNKGANTLILLIQNNINFALILSVFHKILIRLTVQL